MYDRTAVRMRYRPVLAAASILLGLLLLALWLAGAARSAPIPEGDPLPFHRYFPLIRNRPPLSLTLLTDEIWKPTAITSAGQDRLLVPTQAGLVRVISGTEVLDTPFLDLTGEIIADTESGIYDIVLDPDFDTNRFIYVSYLRNLDTSVIARYQVSAANPNVADPASRVEVLTVPQPTPLHNGGDLAFGPDGYLYVSFGDGRCCRDPDRAAQDLGVLLGKIVRIDVSGLPYAIPPDNPYVDVSGARDEIWASGLRNPWRMSFDPLTGDLFIGDVGEIGWEEVSFQPAGAAGGANYGWSCFEGPAQLDTPDCEPPSAYVSPILSYNHDAGCAVIGGMVYRGTAHPIMFGTYVFADWCTGELLLGERQAGNVWTMRSGGVFPLNPTGFGRDANGELLVTGFPDRIYRISPSPLP